MDGRGRQTDAAAGWMRLQGADGLPLFADGAVELELAVVFTLLEVPDEVELPLAIPIRFEAIGGEVPEALENAVLDNVVEDADTVDGPEARRPVPQQDLEDVWRQATSEAAVKAIANTRRLQPASIALPGPF